MGIIDKRLSFSPLTRAEELYKEKGSRTAWNYLNFYQNELGGELSQIGKEFYIKMNKERKSIKHHLWEAGKWARGLESEEEYASIISKGLNYVPYASDLRSFVQDGIEFHKEWRYSQTNQRGHDLVAYAVLGTNLALDLFKFLPGAGHAADPAKKAHPFYKNARIL